MKVRTERIAPERRRLPHGRRGRDLPRPVRAELRHPGVFGVNVNIDRVRHRGLELWANVRPCDWLELYGSYTLDDVKFQRDSLTDLDGHRMPITPRHRGNVGFDRLPALRLRGRRQRELRRLALRGERRRGIAAKLPRFATYDVRVGWRHELASPYGFRCLDATAYNVTGPASTRSSAASASSRPASAFFPSPGRTTSRALGWSTAVKRAGAAARAASRVRARASRSAARAPSRRTPTSRATTMLGVDGAPRRPVRGRSASRRSARGSRRRSSTRRSRAEARPRGRLAHPVRDRPRRPRARGPHGRSRRATRCSTGRRALRDRRRPAPARPRPARGADPLLARGRAAARTQQ